jgi:hypothetical protein
MLAATASSTEGGDGLHLPGLHHNHHSSHNGQRKTNTSNDGGATAVISPRAPAPANALAVVGSPFNGTGNAAGGVMLHEVKVVEGSTPPDWPATGELQIQMFEAVLQEAGLLCVH